MTTHQSKILVVDDDPDIVRLLKCTLNSAGYYVVPGYGAEDALRKVKREHFDLILTDLVMPRMSGVELIELVRQDPQTSDIPILGVTAYVWDQFGRSAADVGCDGFIAKPFEPKQLIRTVAKCLSQSARN